MPHRPSWGGQPCNRAGQTFGSPCLCATRRSFCNCPGSARVSGSTVRQTTEFMRVRARIGALAEKGSPTGTPQRTQCRQPRWLDARLSGTCSSCRSPPSGTSAASRSKRPLAASADGSRGSLGVISVISAVPADEIHGSGPRIDQPSRFAGIFGSLLRFIFMPFGPIISPGCMPAGHGPAHLASCVIVKSLRPIIGGSKCVWMSVL